MFEPLDIFHCSANFIVVMCSSFSLGFVFRLIDYSMFLVVQLLYSSDVHRCSSSSRCSGLQQYVIYGLKCCAPLVLALDGGVILYANICRCVYIFYIVNVLRCHLVSFLLECLQTEFCLDPAPLYILFSAYQSAQQDQAIYALGGCVE